MELAERHKETVITTELHVFKKPEGTWDMLYEIWEIPERAKSKFLKVKNRIRLKNIISGIHGKLDIVDTQIQINMKKFQQEMFRPKHRQIEINISGIVWVSILFPGVHV